MKKIYLTLILIILLFMGGCKPHINNRKRLVEGIEQHIFVADEEVEINIDEILKNINFKYKNAKLITVDKDLFITQKNKIIPVSSGIGTLEIEFIYKRTLYTAEIAQVVSVVKDEFVEIKTYEDLVQMDELKEGYYILKSDIDLNGIDYQPIGNYTEEETFKGMFINPEGYKIKNLTIFSSLNVPPGKYGGRPAGFFGSISDSYIDGLILEDVFIDNTQPLNDETNLTSGSVAAYASNTIITNCTVNGTIKGISRVGGIVGTINKGYIDNCKFTGFVEGKEKDVYLNQDGVGGIAGFATTGPSSVKLEGIFNSHVIATIISSRDKVGGVIGVRQIMPLINSTFTGTINDKESTILIGKSINPFE